MLSEFITTFAPLVCIGCAVAYRKTGGKLDGVLQQHLSTQNSSKLEEEIRVMCQCALPVDERLCKFFTRYGISIIAVMDQSFVASGTVAQIKQLSNSNLITRLHITVTQRKAFMNKKVV